MTITDTPPVEHHAPQRRRTWLIVAAAAAAVLLMVAGVWAVGRGDAEPAGTRDVSFTVEWAGGDNQHPCPTDVSGPICAWTLPGPASAKFTGDLDGTAYQSVVWGNSDRFADRAVLHEEKVATYVFGGTVAGCGTGQFVMIETVQIVSGPDEDYSTGTATGTWEIVPDSGRGDLRNISGSGTSSGLAPDYGRSASGTVTCTPPLDLSAKEIVAPLVAASVPTDRNSIRPVGGDLPNGTYRVEFTAADLDRLEPDVVHDFADGGALEITLYNGTWSLQGFFPSGAKDGGPFGDIYQVDGDTVVWRIPQNAQIPNTDGINVFEWSAGGDTLTFIQIDGKHRDPWFVEPWTRVP